MRVVSENALLDLVGEFYDCTFDSTKWPEALRKFTLLLNGQDATLTLNDIQNPTFSMKAQWNLNPDFEQAMLENYGSNPLLPTLWHTNVDEPFSLLEMVNEGELQTTQWHQNTLAKFGYRDAAIALLEKSTSRFGAVSVQSTNKREPFSREELDVFRKLAPHIRRAALIGEVLHGSVAETQTLRSTLDKLEVGIFLTDGEARVIHVNASADAMCVSGAALTVRGGTLSARDPDSNRLLADAIARAGIGATLDLPRTGIVVSLRSQHEGANLAAWVLPLDKGLRKDLAQSFAAKVAVFVREVGKSSPIPAELFVQRYGITPSESRVLLLLVQGQTPQEIADSLGRSLATVRTQITGLMQKTATSRQSDLIRLAMSVIAPTE